MDVYIKNRSDFGTAGLTRAIEYDLILHSIYDNVSGMTITGNYPGIEGKFIIAGEFIGIVKKAAPDKGMTKLTIDDIVFIFERDLVYPGGGQYIEDFIAAEIGRNYIDIADGVFAMPYLTVETLTHTEFIKPDEIGEEEVLYSLKSYIAKARRVKNIFVDFHYSRGGLKIIVGQRTPEHQNVSFFDKSNQLIEENYTSESVTKVTAVTEGVGTDYYLLADGSVSNDPNADGRVIGNWKIAEVKDAAEQLEKAQDIFSESSHSHSIEFYSNRDIGFYNRVTVVSGEKTLTSYISMVSVSSKDHRKRYKSGELKVTMTDKMKEAVR